MSAHDPASSCGAAGGEAPELVFSVRLRLGGDPPDPDAARLVALLRRMAERASPDGALAGGEVAGGAVTAVAGGAVAGGAVTAVAGGAVAGGAVTAVAEGAVAGGAVTAVAGGGVPAMPVGGGTVRICPEARTVHRDAREVDLTRREFDLLRCLAEHPGRVFGREQLLAGAWGHTWTGPRSVDVHVRRVRVKIGLDLPVISTIRGIGYRLTTGAPVRVVPVGEPPGGGVNR